MIRFIRLKVICGKIRLKVICAVRLLLLSRGEKVIQMDYCEVLDTGNKQQCLIITKIAAK